MQWNVLFTSLAAISCAQAAIVFDNTSDASIGNRGLVTTSQFQSFSNATGAFSLTDLKVVLNGTASASTYSFDLYGDSSTTPSSFLFHIGSNTDSSTPGNCCLFDFPTVPFGLISGARYWIGMSTSNGSGMNWSIDGPFLGHPGLIGVAGEFIDDTGTVTGDNGEAFMMQVNVSPTVVGAGTPEPSTWLLGAAGLGALILARARKQPAITKPQSKLVVTSR